MQNVSQNLRDALTGSFRPVTVVDAWYGGSLVLSDVPITTGSVTLDATRAICGAVSFTAASEDAALLPNRWDSPLAPYGSEVQVRMGVEVAGGSRELVSLGWFRLDDSDPGEWWAPYTMADGTTTWALRGVTVACTGSDRLATVDDAHMLAPTQPASQRSVLAEITRLAQGIIPLASFAGVTDAAIPSSITYQDSRLQAITDLAAVVGAVPRVGPDGALRLITEAIGAPAATITVGTDGQVISWDRKLSRAGIYNGAVSTGDASMTAPVVGTALETTGPLRWGGPFGQVPYGHSSPLITTQAQAAADASTSLARLVRQRVGSLVVTCTANPALELGDTVAVVLPDRTLTGLVRAITWALPMAEMTLTVDVPRDQLWST